MGFFTAGTKLSSNIAIETYKLVSWREKSDAEDAIDLLAAPPLAIKDSSVLLLDLGSTQQN